MERSKSLDSVDKEFKKEPNDGFEEMEAKMALEKEIKHLKQVLNLVQEKLQILENRSDRSTGYTMHLLQKLMTIVEKNENESKQVFPIKFIKGVFKSVKNSCVWAINQLSNPNDYYVDDVTFREIINSNFDNGYCSGSENECENENESEKECEYEYESSI